MPWSSCHCKALVATPRVLPTSKELWGCRILLFCHGWDILRQWLIVIFNHAWERLQINCASLMLIVGAPEAMWHSRSSTISVRMLSSESLDSVDSDILLEMISVTLMTSSMFPPPPVGPRLQIHHPLP